jgi:hypothetical protein
MSLAYDIFERLADGHAVWIKAVASLEEARHHIINLVAVRGRTVRDFFVYDSRRGSVVSKTHPPQAPFSNVSGT